MIFDGRVLMEIGDEEIDVLVQEHVSEHQHLEYKVTLDLKEDSDKLELLRDIASLVNGGGGYLIIGIRDDGKGRAQKYEPERVGNPDRIKKSIISLCNDHISERIDGLEVATREVKGNPLVLVRVPSSTRTPHMVTFQRKTDFWTRYYDGKREMTLGEIKEAFNQDSVALRLSNIEAHLGVMAASEEEGRQRKKLNMIIKSDVVPKFLTIESGQVLAEAAKARFEGEIGVKPYFWIAITPDQPRSNLIDVDSKDIRQLVMEPPGSRRSGWSMQQSQLTPIDRYAEGIRRGSKDFRYLELWGNGHMEFWTPLDDHFCWRQSPDEFHKRPRLYPYPVTEYPVTFLSLYRALVDQAHSETTFLVELQYRNLKGYVLYPYHPSSFEFQFEASDVNPFPEKHLVVPRNIANAFDPHKDAYELIKTVYASFGFGPDAIPFFNSVEGRFHF